MPDKVPIHQSEEDLYLPDEPEVSATRQIVDSKAKRLEEWRGFFVHLFDFRSDKVNDLDTIESIRQDVDFRGTKLWVLICAILVASLGLNINSTAVIIGAMCISPLMGPIIGFGTALGIYDFELLKRSLRNLGMTTLFSILSATIYFLLSPIKIPASELLARTYPTVYDVLIALFGGAAGMIAISTKSKGQVLPGVAIATALMPPLCTVGFGIANGQWTYVAGALYLFLINSVFIAFATYVVVRVLRLPKKGFLDPNRGKKVRRMIVVITVCTVLPSIYLSVQLVQDTVLNRRIDLFVKEAFKFSETAVVRNELTIKDGKRNLSVLLIGEPLRQHTIDSVSALMPKYGISGVTLSIRQGILGEEADMGELRSVLLKDLYENSEAIIAHQSRQIDSLKSRLATFDRYNELQDEMLREMKVLFPNVRNAFFSSMASLAQGRDSVIQVVVQPTKPGAIGRKDQERLKGWIATRTASKEARIIIDNPK